MKYTHRLVLIAGVSGSGKTTLLKYFKKQGKNVLDGSTTGIGIWVDVNGVQRKKPTEKEWKTRQGFDWQWDLKTLKRELKRYKRKELYAFSDAANLSEIIPLFEERYWLNADTKLILSRLNKRAKDKSAGQFYGKTYGATKAQRDYVLSRMKPNSEWPKKMGFKYIDAALTPEAIFKIITS